MVSGRDWPRYLRLMTSPAAPLIETPEAFARLVDTWRHEAVVGLDTEAASFHRFHDRVYLLQLSTATETVIVDPVGSGGLEPLRPWFEEGNTEFIFHDADYDLRLMYHEYGLRIQRLFDTRVAAQFLNLPAIGLGAILEARFGVRTNKRFQRADWSARPLAPEMIDYAATDTRHLPALRLEFMAELSAAGRLGWVEEECTLLTRVEWASAGPDDERFLKLKGARDLDRRGLAVLRELFQWRESVGADLDRALFRVMGNEVLLQLAADRPEDVAALSRIRGFGADNLARRSADVLAAIARGLAVPDDVLPAFPRRARHRPDPAFESRLDRLKAWRIPAAERYQLSPGLIAPNATLEAIARAAPSSIEGLRDIAPIRRWQIEEFGGEWIAAANGA